MCAEKENVVVTVAYSWELLLWNYCCLCRSEEVIVPSRTMLYSLHSPACDYEEME